MKKQHERKLVNITQDKENWWIGDFETITSKTQYFNKKKDTGIVLFGLCNYVNETFKNGISISEMFEFLKSTNKSTSLFFHNLSFDGDFILKYIANHTNLKPNHSKYYQSNTFSVFRQGKVIYQINICLLTKNKRKIQIVIKDSLKILSYGVAGLGKSLKMNKYTEQQLQDKQFYDKEPVNNLNELETDYINYCNNDCLIVNKSLKNFDEVITDLPILKKYIEKKKTSFNTFYSKTAAGISFRLMEGYVWMWLNLKGIEKPAPNMYLEMDTENREFLTRVLAGGFTQFNEEFQNNGKEVSNMYYIDRNSAYPAEMLKPLPYGEMLTEPPEGDYCSIIIAKVKSAKIKKKYYKCVMLKNWKKSRQNNNRYVRELNDFECTYFDNEWELIKKFYDMEIIEENYIFFKTAPFLKYYAAELYAKRQEFSRTKNDAFKQSIKILLNAGYGCLALRTKFNSYVYLEKQELELGQTFTIGKTDYIFRGVNSTYEINRDKFMLAVLENPKVKSTCRNMVAAARITSEERVCLYSLIAEINPAKFAYCDTDSIIFYNLNIREIDRLNKYLGDDLGEWKIETDKGRYFKVDAAKRYAMFDEKGEVIKKGFAGVGHKDLDINTILKSDWKMDEITIKDATIKPAYYESGIVLELVDKTLKKGTI